MDIGKKINSGPGYAICDVENTIILKNLRFFIRSMTKKTKQLKTSMKLEEKLRKCQKVK